MESGRRKTGDLREETFSSWKFINFQAIAFVLLIWTDKKLTFIVCLSVFFFPVHGNYSTWSRWGTCSASCGPGVRKRTRACNNPAPEYGGLTCKEKDLGPNVESSKCDLGDCPGKSMHIAILGYRCRQYWKHAFKCNVHSSWLNIVLLSRSFLCCFETFFSLTALSWNVNYQCRLFACVFLGEPNHIWNFNSCAFFSLSLQWMVFGVLGLCGQRVQPVAAQVLERENDRATARLPNMEANLVVEQRGKLETAVIDHAQVTIKVLLFLACLLYTSPSPRDA